MMLNNFLALILMQSDCPFGLVRFIFSYHSLAKRLLSFFTVTVLKFAISQSEVYCPDVSRYQVTDRPDIITVTLNFGLNL